MTSRAVQHALTVNGASISTDNESRQNVNAIGGTSSALARAILVFMAQKSATITKRQ
jgi:hypothetical protein